MSEGSVLSGTPAAAPAQPSNAPSTLTGSVPQTAENLGGNAPAAAPSPAAPASSAWYDQPEYAETVAWAKQRGYKVDDPGLVGEALRGHHNAEKLIGLDRAGRTLVVPKADAPQAEWDSYYSKLGRPATPKDYAIPAELKDDPLMQKFAETAHSKGYTNDQVKAVVDFMAEQSQAIEAQQEQEYERQSIQQVDALRSEWGQEFELRSETALRARRELGLDKETAIKLEKTLGVDRAAKLFFEIGKKIMEPAAEGMTGGSSKFGLSKSEAAAQIQLLKKDQGFTDRLVKQGDAAAKAEWDRLHQLAYGG